MKQIVKKINKIHREFWDREIFKTLVEEKYRIKNNERLLKLKKQKKLHIKYAASKMSVEYSGLEPLTSTLPVLRSSQMS